MSNQQNIDLLNGLQKLIINMAYLIDKALAWLNILNKEIEKSILTLPVEQ